MPIHCLHLLLLLLLLPPCSARCRFALDYTCPELLSSPPAVQSFLLTYASAQAAFASDGVGLDAGSGLTFDGHPLNYSTGQPCGQPHTFSAASKESLHLSLLALAVQGNAIAAAALGGRASALQALAAKLASYTRFNATLPGYGCHLPWFEVPSLQPTADWAHPARVPALDNGQLAWAVFAAARVLAAAAAAGEPALLPLAQGWAAWFTCMASSAKTVFYAGQGRVAAVAVVLNASAPPSAGNYERSGGGLLNDPYEGELFTVLLDLFAPWDSPAERQLLWAVKRPQLQAVNYSSAGGPITAQRGWWFSAHENWKAALLPYAQLPRSWAVLGSSERARSWQAAEAGWPGLLASASDLAAVGSQAIPDYVSALGVPALASPAAAPPSAYRHDVLAPYGSWQLLLHSRAEGACWLRSVLAAPRMQGPAGATEAVASNGTLISPLATWDTTMTVVLAAAGGVGGIVGEALRLLPPGAPPAAGWAGLRHPLPPGASAFDQFSATLEEEYGRAFPVLAGMELPFEVPRVQVPQDALQPWPSCQ